MILLLLAQMVHMPAGGIPQAVPATKFTCELTASDGTRFTVAGTTPLFAAGSDPNKSEFVPVESSHPEAFRGRVVAVRPGDSSQWFREFEINGSAPNDVSYALNLMLRRDGTSVAYTTRYQSTGKPIPYDYHAAGLCRADFGQPIPDKRR